LNGFAYLVDFRAQRQQRRIQIAQQLVNERRLFLQDGFDFFAGEFRRGNRFQQANVHQFVGGNLAPSMTTGLAKKNP